MMTDVHADPSPKRDEQPTILLVDDNPTNLGVLFETLNDSGFRLLIAEDGEAALEQIQYVTPDIILLDVMMPGLSGFETCQRIKDNPSTQDIPIIFMTALSETVDKVTGLSIGGVDYITKPIQPDEVLARVQVHLSIHSLQRQLQEKNQALEVEIQERERAERALRLLVRAVSHDLKNPVTGMLLVLQNMLQTAVPRPVQVSQDVPDGDRSLSLSLDSGSSETSGSSEMMAIARPVIERMIDSAKRQLNLINSLLETHALEASGFPESDASRTQEAMVLRCQPVAFDRLVHSIIQDIEPLLNKNRGILSNQVPSDLPLVYGDENQLWRVLENLLTNAIKHNPPGVHVAIAAQVRQAMLHCQIQDDGEGIPIEEQSALFEPYRRGQNRHHTPGLGLGLYLCRQIIQAHGGDIGLSSGSGRGTTFWFTLPLAS